MVCRPDDFQMEVSTEEQGDAYDKHTPARPLGPAEAWDDAARDAVLDEASIHVYHNGKWHCPLSNSDTLPIMNRDIPFYNKDNTGYHLI